MPTLYLDMDGVLADFNGLAAQVLNADSKEKQQASQNGKWSETDSKKAEKALQEIDFTSTSGGEIISRQNGVSFNIRPFEIDRS